MVKCPPIRPFGVPCEPVVVYGCMPNVPLLLILNSVASFAPLDACSDHLYTELVPSVSAHAHCGTPFISVHSDAVFPPSIWNA